MVEKGGPGVSMGARGGLSAISFGGLGASRGGGEVRVGVSGLSLANFGGIRSGEGRGASVVPSGRRSGPLGMPVSPFSMEGSARIPQASPAKALEDDWNGGASNMSARDDEEERRLRKKLAEIRALLESL